MASATEPGPVLHLSFQNAVTEPTTTGQGDDRDRTRRVRRSAIILGLVAFAFYVAFILMAVTGVRG